MRDDETLAAVLERFDRAERRRRCGLVETADLDAAVPVPRDAPWFPEDVDAWSVRWVIFHLIATSWPGTPGTRDIIRESIDGATMYELIAGAGGRRADRWLTPWARPRSARAPAG